MICPACRHGNHHHCEDLPRQHAEDAGKIPAVTPGTGLWCYCAHAERAPQSLNGKPPRVP